MGRMTAVGLLILFPILVLAQPAPQAAPPLPAEQAAAEPTVNLSTGLDEHVAQQAFLEAEIWISQGKVPEEAIEPILTNGLSAVQATIRRNGITFGTGMASITDPAGGINEAVDLTRLLRSAVAQALLDDRSKPQALREEHPNLTLDLQFAGPLHRLVIGHMGELPSMIKMNLDGLAIENGQRWAWGFPGTATAANINLKSQLTRLIAQEDLGLNLTDLPAVGTTNGPRLYRFRVIHLARSMAGGELVLLHRGQALNPVAAIDDAGLYQLSQHLARHLTLRQQEDGRFRGTYDPSGDQYLQPLASPAQTALAAFALARSGKAFPPQTTQYQERIAAARMAINHLLQPPAENSRDPVTPSLSDAAIQLLALLETPGMGHHTKTLWRLSTQLHVYLKMPEGQFHVSHDGQGHGQPASLHTQALATAALVKLYDMSRNPDFLERATACLKTTWKMIDQEPSLASSAMPWLSYAETDLARLDRRQPSLNRLLKLTDEFWNQQMMPWDPKAAEQSPDVFGGFALEMGLYPEPNWHSARILAACSLVLGAPDLVPADQQARWVVNCAYAARFLDQLTFKPSDCYYVRNPSAALGGLRLAFWNNQLPLDATAMGLLATAEMQYTLQRLADLGRQQPAAQTPGTSPAKNAER